MPFELIRTEPFERQFRKILKQFPRSAGSINSAIDDLADNLKGDAYPGFYEFTIMKLRIPLKEYKIGKSSGLRLVYLLLEDKNKLIPLLIYYKVKFPTEHKVKKMIKKKLKEVLEYKTGGPNGKTDGTDYAD
ncbi:hypothetical protein QUF72_09815 [Desulfobacterales bacterium HSG2]|nr:hypothetical protein [Desulfobacterales bacterium HSG2]